MLYYVVTTIAGISTEKEMEANNLNELLDKINKTQRGKMEYTVFDGKPFTFENLVYSHHIS